MAFVVKTAKTLRNHWKKSTFAACGLIYSGNMLKTHLQTQDLMRQYCEIAAELGKQPIPVHQEPRTVTVILNPNANKRKCNDEFEKYCAPLLHLAGICVNIIKTESEGHAKTLMENVQGTDAIVVAGGDGTLSEVVTGLLRRTNENTNGLVPIGILPLGKTNEVASNYYSMGNKLEKVKALCEATMAVILEGAKPVDIMKIEVMEAEDNKPVYAVGGIKWGAYRDAEVKKDSYWYFGGLKKYATYLFNGYKNTLSWKCDAVINYSPPCSGCVNCVTISNSPQGKKWFQKFIKDDNPQLQKLKIENPVCREVHEKKIVTSDFKLAPALSKDQHTPSLKLSVGPENVDYFEFVKEGWRSENGKGRHIEEVIEARKLELKPQIQDENQKDGSWFSIDNEVYEVKPIRVTLLPNVINMFFKSDKL